MCVCACLRVLVCVYIYVCMCAIVQGCVQTYQLLAHQHSRIVSAATPVAEETDVLIAADLGQPLFDRLLECRCLRLARSL